VTNAVALCSLYEPAVAMSDTLLDSLDADEATAIFAHEIAHHEHFDATRLRKRRSWAALSEGEYAFATEMSAVPEQLVAVLSGRGGARLAVYRVEAATSPVALTDR
jgi:Zn-dependent protease with chaperone function